MLNNKEQYNRFFQQSPESSYGKPSKVVDMIPDYVPLGTALDIGAGDGRHSIFLATKGFAVKAIDTSSAGLEKLRRFAEKEGVVVDTIVADCAQWTFDHEYDVIVAVNIFQHLKSEDALRIMDDMKKHTRPNGVNAISLFTNDGDRYLLDREEDPHAFYPDNGWLKEFYCDWEIMTFEESEVTLIAKVRPDGTPMRSIVARMLARKHQA